MRTKASIIEFFTSGKIDDVQYEDKGINKVSELTLETFSSLYDSLEPVTVEFTTGLVKLKQGWGIELLLARKDAHLVIEILEKDVASRVVSHTDTYDWEWRDAPLEVLVGEFNAKYGDKLDEAYFTMHD